MKRTALLALPVAALGVAGFAVASTTSVSITAAGPTPATITVHPGDAVQLINADTVAHAVTGKGLVPSSTAPVPPGGTVTLPVTQTGKFGYSVQGVANGRGTVVVQELTTGQGLSLAASIPFVTYGSHVTLRGRSPEPSGVVQIDQRLQGVGSWEPLTSVVATRTGTFSVIVEPKRGVQYRARVGEGKTKLVTPPVAIGVKPLVSLRLSAKSTASGHPVAARVSISPRDAATTVNLMRYNPTLRVWQRVAGHQLDATGSATIQWAVMPGRSLLRGWLSARTIHGGYIIGFSQQLPVTGIGALPVKQKKHAKTGGHGHGHGKGKKAAANTSTTTTAK